jgi:hypothetical protein
MKTFANILIIFVNPVKSALVRYFLAGVFLFMITGFTVLRAQEVISATGGTVKSSGGSVSYSVGQVAYTTHSGAGGTVTQGVQQPYMIAVISEIPDARGISLECTVYPNPAGDFVLLKVENYVLKNLAYALYDMNGKLILNNIIEGRITSISLENLLRADYLLKVTDNQAEIKVFKVVKK